jgi:hypothetical protein
LSATTAAETSSRARKACGLKPCSALVTELSGAAVASCASSPLPATSWDPCGVSVRDWRGSIPRRPTMTTVVARAELTAVDVLHRACGVDLIASDERDLSHPRATATGVSSAPRRGERACFTALEHDELARVDQSGGFEACPNSRDRSLKAGRARCVGTNDVGPTTTSRAVTSYARGAIGTSTCVAHPQPLHSKRRDSGQRADMVRRHETHASNARRAPASRMKTTGRGSDQIVTMCPYRPQPLVCCVLSTRGAR